MNVLFETIFTDFNPSEELTGPFTVLKDITVAICSSKIPIHICCPAQLPFNTTLRILKCDSSYKELIQATIMYKCKIYFV